MDKENKKYFSGLDLVRICAMVLVVTVHMFHFNNFYNTPIGLNSSIGLILLSMFRNFCMICVPLFIVLSGYLMKNKTVSKSYYKKLIRIIFEYFLCCLCCYVFNVVWNKKTFVVKDFVIGFFNFTDAPYSWYINMYIGLFLLIPFINLAYNSLKNDVQKLIMVFSAIFIFSFVLIFNYAPKYWSGIAYPLMYYVIGLYLRDKQPKVNKFKLVGITIILLVMQVIMQYGIYNSKVFNMGRIADHDSIITVGLTVCVFLFLYDINIKNVFTNKCLRRISSASLSFFLVSWIFDTIYYNKLRVVGQPMKVALLKQLYVVPLIIVSSMILSVIIDTIVNLTTQLFAKISAKKKTDCSDGGGVKP